MASGCWLLQQVRVLDPVSQTDQIADVLIAEGRIQAIASQIADVPVDTQRQDCQGLILGPGLVDLYSHSGEPGFEERETLASLMLSAIHGGFTRLAILPDTKPPLDSPAMLSWLKQQSNTAARQIFAAAAPQIYFWGALTLDLAGQQMTELTELAAAGVVGFTDGQPLADLGLLRRLLEYVAPLGQPVAIWPCDRQLVGPGVMREGAASIRFGLSGNPAIAETAALAALLECIAVIGTPVHLMRISTARGVELIQSAKNRGLPITASTTWMHLLFNSEDLASYNPALRLDPPLGNPDDQAALINGLKAGIIDAIAIDHTPYTYEEKTVAFSSAPPGVIGLELALPLLWHFLVETNRWSALQLWQVLSTQPALCLKQTPAAIAVGQPAELTLFNPQIKWKVNLNNLHSRSVNTPWLEKYLIGRVMQTWNLPFDQIVNII